MADDDVLSVVKSELARFGVKPDVTTSGSGHKRITWHVTPEKPERCVVVPSTTSDWHARMNARADVRRYLNADSAVPIRGERAPKQSALAKAISLPALVESVPDQLENIRHELNDMSLLLLDFVGKMMTTRGRMP